MRVLQIFRNVFVAGIACLLIGQPTYAVSPRLTQNSNTKWQHLPSLYEENEFDVNEFIPESSIPEPYMTSSDDMTSSDVRQKRDAVKKSRPENDGVDTCKPCHGPKTSAANFDVIGNNNYDDGDGILENLQTMWGMVDVAQMHTQDLLDGYKDNGRKESHESEYAALQKKIRLPKRVKALNGKRLRKLIKNEKNLAKFMRQHYQRLSTVHQHLHYIHADEESLDRMRESPLLNDTKLLRAGMNTLLCQLYKNQWSPPECKKPKDGKISKLYDENISNRVDTFNRDLIILRYNNVELMDLEDAVEILLECLSDKSKCLGGKKGKKNGRRARQGRGNNRQRKRKDRKNRKNNKNQNRKKNRAEN